MIHIQVHEYEKCYIEIPSYYRHFLVNNVLEFHMTSTKDKYTGSFTKVLVTNKSHRVYHVIMIEELEHYFISFDINVGILTVI